MARSTTTLRTTPLRRSTTPAPSRLLAPALPAALLLVLFAFAPTASAADPVWVAVQPGAAPGTEARIELDPSSSTNLRSTVDVHIFGFWREDLVGDDGQIYQRITVPGLTNLRQPGQPDLPVARFALAVPTVANVVTPITSSASNTVIIPSIQAWPAPIPGNDDPIDPLESPGPGDTQGNDDVFTLDPLIYGQVGPFPATPDAGSAPVRTMFGHYPGAMVQVHPVSWDPSVQRLFVNETSTFVFDHGGALQSLGQATKKKQLLAAGMFVNWPSAGAPFGLFSDSYEARYLIVTPAPYAAGLGAFILHKKILGYQVTVRVPASATPVAIAAEIDTWYAQGDPGMDHFVLLVGDADLMPPVDVFSVGDTDDPYATIGGGAFPQVHLGRVSVDGVTDLQNQLQKIMDYEVQPITDVDYGRVVLVAHDQNAPGKYTAAHLKVATASYASSPDFDLQFGFFGATDSDVRASINAGAGLVAYRGHGSTYSWTDWNPAAEYFHKNDIAMLANASTILPIVWSFACTNSNIGVSMGGGDDCFGEAWLENATVGGVAHYGATDTTKTSYNHLLDEVLFDLVYDQGVVVHGQALDFAELLMTVYGWQGSDQKRYMLLGDPSMAIRRDVYAKPTVTGFPIKFTSTAPGDTQDLLIQVDLPDGSPLAEAQVSLYKASAIPGADDELLVNGYTNGLGELNFVFELPTSGVLHWSVQDQLGNIAVGTVPVDPTAAWGDLGNGLAGLYGTPRLGGEGSLAGGTPYALVLTDAHPVQPAWLVLGLAPLSAPFKGGVLVPHPDLIVSGLVTSAAGDLALDDTWPTGVPSGASFFTQFWITEPGAPSGFAASNGLRGTTP